MLSEPFKFNLNPEVQSKDRESSEAQASALMAGPLNTAFNESFNILIVSLLAVPLDQSDRILGMVAQIKALIHVHENMRDMIASHKMRTEENKRSQEMESEKAN